MRETFQLNLGLSREDKDRLTLLKKQAKQPITNIRVFRVGLETLLKKEKGK